MNKFIIPTSILIILLNGIFITSLWLNNPYGGCNIRDGLGNEMDLKPIAWNYHWLRYTKGKPDNLTASLWGFSKVFWRIYHERETIKTTEKDPNFIEGTLSLMCAHCGLEFPSVDGVINNPKICPKCGKPPWKMIGDE